MANEMTHTVEGDKVLVLERVFDAPRELVFEMFTDCRHLEQWWGPRGWELPVCKMDFRPGGTWLYCMKCVDEAQGDFYGMESWGKQVFKAIDAPRSLSYTDYFSDADGNVNDSLPATDATVEFIEHDGKTKIVSRSTYATAEALKTVMDMGMLQGITETWDRLEERLGEVAPDGAQQATR